MRIWYKVIYSKLIVEDKTYKDLLLQCEEISTLYSEVAKSYHHFATARNQVMPPKTIAGFCMNGGVAVVAKEDKKTVGTALLFPHGGRSYEMMIGIHPLYQSQKIGSGLLQKTLEVMEQVQAKNICLMVTADNLKAIGLYKKHGFKQVGQSRRNYFDEEDPITVFVMEKNIVPNIPTKE